MPGDDVTMPRRCEIREAEPADATAIGAFLHAVWDEAGPGAPGFAGATAELIDELASPDAVCARLGGPTRRMVIAVRSHDVVGFAAMRALTTNEVELAGIVVRRAVAGQGIGRRLVQAALDVSQQTGATSVVVRTERDNVAAVGFYESLDFRRVRDSVETVEGVEVAVVELRRPI